MGNLKVGVTILALVLAASLLGGWIGWQVRLQNGTQEVLATPDATSAYGGRKDLLRATYDPIHFRPAIEGARDEQCLACHREVLDDKVRPTSPAGIKAAASKAWYQQLSTYAGEQDTFHRRHLATPLAKELMNLSCTTCHQGSDPRDEAPATSATGTPQGDTGFTLRKTVNPETACLKCHGPLNAPVMGLPSPWPESMSASTASCAS